MKKRISDKFIWDIFNAASKTEDVLRVLIHPPRKWSEVFWSSNDPIYQKYYKLLQRQKFAQLIYYLKRKNYIKIESLKGKRAMMITKKGIDKVFRASFQMVEKRKREDGKWIMIIFDIPQNHRKARNLLRSILKNLDYKMFQQSVWLTPYDVLETTGELLQYHSLDTYARIFIVEEP